MSTDTQKVDVLAVLDKHVAAERALGYEAAAREGELARAAVAGLIEATGELITFAEPILKNHGFGYMGKVEKAKRCLARVGGAK